MRVSTALTVTLFLAISLGCARGNREGTDDTGLVDETNLAQFSGTGVGCDGVDWEFSAQTWGEVTLVEVEPWVGDTQYATQDLVHRGNGDWFLQANAALVGGDCSYTDQFVLFRLYRPDGTTLEEAN